MINMRVCDLCRNNLNGSISVNLDFKVFGECGQYIHSQSSRFEICETCKNKILLAMGNIEKEVQEVK